GAAPRARRRSPARHDAAHRGHRSARRTVIHSGRMQMDKASKRFGKRTALELPVRLSADGTDKGRGIIRNASISGALIETTVEFPLNTNLSVAFDTRGSK